jgi:hypothetical protein
VVAADGAANAPVVDFVHRPDRRRLMEAGLSAVDVVLAFFILVFLSGSLTIN